MDSENKTEVFSLDGIVSNNNSVGQVSPTVNANQTNSIPNPDNPLLNEINQNAEVTSQSTVEEANQNVKNADDEQQKVYLLYQIIILANLILVVVSSIYGFHNVYEKLGITPIEVIRVAFLAGITTDTIKIMGFVISPILLLISFISSLTQNRKLTGITAIIGALYEATCGGFIGAVLGIWLIIRSIKYLMGKI